MSRIGLVERLLQRLWWIPLGQVPELSAAELAQRLKLEAPPQLIDVRTRAEWRRSHIVHSINVPITELRQRLPTLDLDPNRAVLAICLSAHRSIPAVRLLRASGFEEVAQLKGGMLAWWRARAATTLNSGP